MEPDRTVELFLDFISPYTWLALQAAPGFGRRHRVRWELRPVVYAALLDAHGLVGPAEVEAKRRYTFHDVARCAAAAGLPLVGPPAHPFRSLEALRTMELFRREAAAPELAAALSHAAWGEGRDLTDTGVLAEVVAACGLDCAGLPERIASPEVKGRLREATERALRIGVFGVPTFRHRQRLFWGHDRMPHLAAALAGEEEDAAELAERMLARPRGARQRRAPGREG